MPVKRGSANFHASATLLWNRLDDKLKNMANESNSKKHLLGRFVNINASRKHFSITRTFYATFIIIIFYLNCTVPTGSYF